MCVRGGLWALLVCAVAYEASAYTCRQDPRSATKNCGLPVNLANFQGDAQARGMVLPRVDQNLRTELVTWLRLCATGSGARKLPDVR